MTFTNQSKGPKRVSGSPIMFPTEARGREGTGDVAGDAPGGIEPGFDRVAASLPPGRVLEPAAPSAWFSEHRIFALASGAIALHIADGEFLHRQPGTAAGDHVLAGVVPIAVALVASLAYRRLRPGVRAAVSLVFGLLSLVDGMVVLGGARAEGLSRSEWSGLLLLPAGAALIVLSAWVPWRARARHATTQRRMWTARVAAALTTPLLLFYVVFPIGAALWATQKSRTPIGTFSVPHQDVSFRTSDGLTLSGWYVPSRNGAAIVIVHGGGGDRDGARAHAAMLARAGYGVLLYDARGRGQSQGNNDAYGWTWGRDVDAALAWLNRRPDVNPGRIGALGLSTGADVLIETAARRHDIRAVVADGATARSVDDTRAIVHGGGLLSIPFWWTQYTAAQILENAGPGKPLAQLAAQIRTPILFIASNWSVERAAAPIYARAANQPGDLWEVNSGHTQGLHDYPRQYAKHVLGFFERALLGRH